MKSRLEAQFVQIKKLEEELSSLLIASPEAEFLEKDNKKLIYQIDVLKKSIERERSELKPLTGI